MKHIKNSVLSLVLLFLVSACIPAPLIIAGGAGGGTYAFTSDHIKDKFDISKEQAFETLIGIITSNDGKVVVSSIADGKIEARIGKSILFVRIKPLNERTIEVSFRAKKHIELIPDKETSIRYYRLFIKEVTK
ncbi:MAG: hypothetical protein C0602_13415 [Denitrovibrio sp.]|nr:MAG: hypothetical protein C0602_13415 [Denitrovibrio sp.]